MRTMKNWRITFIPLVALSLATCSAQNDKPLQPLDDVMMQALEVLIFKGKKSISVSRDLTLSPDYYRIFMRRYVK